MDRDQAVKIIIKLVEKKFGITFEDIIFKSRKKYLLQPKRELAYALRHTMRMSYPEIGLTMDRDHTSIIHLLKGFTPAEPLNLNTDFSNLRFDSMQNGFYMTDSGSGGKWSRLFAERGAKCDIIECGFDDVIEIHHLISKRLHGGDDTSNLLMVCPNHHKMIHQGLIKLNPKAYPMLRIPIHLSTAIAENKA